MPNIYPVYTTMEPQPKIMCEALQEQVFDYPFYNDGVPHTRVSRGQTYRLDDLELADESEALELKGLIFHTSHCGSTLLSRMLGQVKNVRVVTESEAINGLLLVHLMFGLPEEEVVLQLQKIIRAYSQGAEEKQHLMLKLTSWNVYLIRLFQQAFPGVKWLYLDRDSAALLNSLEKADGGILDWWNSPTDILWKHFVLDRDQVTDKTSFLKAIMEGHYHYAHQHKNEQSLFLKYPHFLDAFGPILGHFGLAASAEEIAQAQEQRKYNAKTSEPIAGQGFNS